MTNEAQKYDTKILEKWLDGGLCSGAGDGKNAVCLEQAVALCAGLPLTDRPDSCVDPVVSQFGRSLNDLAWSSPKARADGLRAFAFAQLGTVGRLDSLKFTRRIAEMFIAEILPSILRMAAKIHPVASHAIAISEAADKCESSKSPYAAADAAYAAANAAYAAADAADAAYAAAAAADAAAAAAAAADAARDKILSDVAALAARAIKEQLP
jgi:hypothetical protein